MSTKKIIDKYGQVHSVTVVTGKKLIVTTSGDTDFGHALDVLGRTLDQPEIKNKLFLINRILPKGVRCLSAKCNNTGETVYRIISDTQFIRTTILNLSRPDNPLAHPCYEIGTFEQFKQWVAEGMYNIPRSFKTIFNNI